MSTAAPDPLRLARIAAAVLAVVVAAWFLLAARQARDTASAQAIAAGKLTISAGSARRANSLLDSAGTLNPDRMVKLLRADIEVERGQNRQAITLILSLTKKEPLNRAVWALLARAAVGYDPALGQEAIVHLAILERSVKTGPRGS